MSVLILACDARDLHEISMRAELGEGAAFPFNPDLLSSASFFPGTQTSPSSLKPAGATQMLMEG